MPTTGKRLYQPHKRTLPAPLIVRFLRCAIKAESDVRDGVTVGGNHGPNALEMPTVRHEAGRQSFTRDGRNGFGETVDGVPVRRQ